MRPSSRILAARHLLRSSRFQPSTAAAASSVFRRLDGTNGQSVAKPLRNPHLGELGPNCRVFPGSGAPFAHLNCLLPDSTYPPHCARPLRDLVTSAYRILVFFFTTYRILVSTLRCIDTVVHDRVLPYTLSMFY
uniref:Uncharacterized protein n=1 Tax=Aegilops tauschii subsp. strangulata TaxID=200361 RepID=A0A453I6C0_AEGTS